MKENLRIFIIDTYYGSFLSDHYKKLGKKISLSKSSYSDLKKEIIDECFGTSDFYTKAFNDAGCIAEEFISNDAVLQKKWARENNIKLSPLKNLVERIPLMRRWVRDYWLYQILEAQITAFKPDIIFNKNIGFIDAHFLLNQKKAGKKIVGQIASKLPDRKFFDPYDLIFSSLPHYVEKFKSWGIESRYVQLAFDSRVLKRIHKNDTTYDVTHVGGYGPTHAERNELLEKIATKTHVDFWGYGVLNLTPNSPIKKTFKGSAWGMDMYYILANSKITLTKHITSVADKYANNMTLYEATGCGCLLITDAKENLPNIFVPGKEIVTYSSPQELDDKIKYYLKNETERKMIAEAGQKRTLNEHTYAARVKQMIEALHELFKNAS